jgi:hypothetical protein
METPDLLGERSGMELPNQLGLAINRHRPTIYVPLVKGATNYARKIRATIFLGSALAHPLNIVDGWIMQPGG